MKFPTKTIIASTLMLAMSTPLMAQDPAAGYEDRQQQQRGPIVIAEARERAANRAAAMDTDGDGYISIEERKAFHETRRAERMQKMMERRGVDADSRVAVEDFVARRVAWLEKLDVNGDGIVDQEEMRAARGKHGRHHGGMKGKSDGRKRGERRAERGE